MEYMDFKKKDDREVLQLERFPLEKGELPVLHYPLLDACGMVKHCFTTRGGGASKGMFESLNLSFTRGDDEADVQENYARVQAMELPGHVHTKMWTDWSRMSRALFYRLFMRTVFPCFLSIRCIVR